MSLWLMAAALEHQTRSQEIRAICAEAMQNLMGQAYIVYRHTDIQYSTFAHTVNRLNVLTCYY